MASMEGNLIADRYLLERRVGAGGMGTVWRATDTRLQRTVAVKLLNEAIRHDPGATERFRREARIAATVDHPSIARVYEFVAGETPAIVMEFVEGHTLADRLAAGPVPVEDAIRIVSDVLAALASAHAMGIVHRDIKPSNVLLSYDGVVKVADLGIARAPGDQTVTGTGAVLGSLHYCAPERLRGEQTTAASDVYGVGAMLYEMLSGRRPFDGETPAAVMAAHLSARPEPLRRIDPQIPPRLEAVVMRALEPEVARRFRDAGAMRAALLSREEPVHTDVLALGPDAETMILTSRAQQLVPTTVAPVPPPWFGRRVFAWLAPALLLAAVVASAVMALAGRPAPVPGTTPSPTVTTTPSPEPTQEPPPDVVEAVAGLLATIVKGADTGAIADGLDDELIKDVEEVRQAARDLDRSTALAEVAELRDEVEQGWDDGAITRRRILRRLRQGIDDLEAAIERTIPERDEEDEEEREHPGQGRGRSNNDDDD